MDRGAWRATVHGVAKSQLNGRAVVTQTGFFSCSPCWQVKFFSPSLNSKLSWGASLVAQLVKNPPAMQKTWVWSLGWGDPLEKGMATHSSILAWRIPMDREAWRVGYNGVAKSRTPWTTFTLLYLTFFIIIIVKEVEYSIQLMYCHILHCSPCSYCWTCRSFSISAILENATMKCHTQGFTIL